VTRKLISDNQLDLSNHVNLFMFDSKVIIIKI
jgi:hypothetical protein